MYIRCRANTQKESRRMERVQPDVLAATQRESRDDVRLYSNFRFSSPHVCSHLLFILLYTIKFVFFQVTMIRERSFLEEEEEEEEEA